MGKPSPAGGQAAGAERAKDKPRKDKSKKDKVKKEKSKSKSKKTKTKESKKAKEPKRPKEAKEQKEPEVAATAEGGTAAPSGWNNWAAAEFSSDARKAKFLRFMGIKKDGGGEQQQGASPFESAISKEGASRIQSDLEKQFGAGIRHRGQRGGLGS
ncbi:hypothetical protein H4R18_000285 [Coemansia javaensis]|uniref:Small acidic protein n=1 Tax=Coemansia javaensis TaxID=2761396 RepID=A0A9W8HLR6_9FUNG|nr:hypothetical protein H4R18_000285 [Coemansia javaensis]